MTAEQIRSSAPRLSTMQEQPESIEMQKAEMLTEIAAQLAELNASLVKLIPSDPKTGWPRLTVDILK